MGERAQEPLLMRSGLTGRVYIVTRYKRLDADGIVAGVKYDVTEQFDALAEDDRLSAVRAECERIAASSRIKEYAVAQRNLATRLLRILDGGTAGGDK